jgi:plastocyanin
MRKAISTLVFVAVFVALWPAVAPARAPRIQATTERTWSPDFLHLTPGDAAVFKNPTEEPHDIKRYKGPWKRGKVFLYPGDTWKKRFKKKGAYKYRCVLHSQMVDGRCEGMCGVVHVAK